MDMVPGGIPVDIEGDHETRVSEGVMLEGKIGEGCIPAEVGVAALVDLQRLIYVCDQVFDEKIVLDIGPPGAGVGEFCLFYEVEGLLFCRVILAGVGGELPEGVGGEGGCKAGA